MLEMLAVVRHAALRSATPKSIDRKVLRSIRPKLATATSVFEADPWRR
jgi:hypothetical protein